MSKSKSKSKSTNSSKSMFFFGKGLKEVWSKAKPEQRKKWIVNTALLAVLGGYVVMPAALGVADHAKRMDAVKQIELLSDESVSAMPHADLVSVMQAMEPQSEKKGINVLRYVRIKSEEILATTQGERILGAVEKIYARAGLDPDYVAYYAEARESWMKFLEADDFVTTAKEKWYEAPPKEKVRILEFIMAKHADLYGFEPVEFKLVDDKVWDCYYRDKCSAGTWFVHDYKTDTAYAIIDKMGFDVFFEQVLREAVAVNYNAFVRQLIKKNISGEISRFDPRYEQIELFRLNNALSVERNLSSDYWQSLPNGQFILRQWVNADTDYLKAMDLRKGGDGSNKSYGWIEPTTKDTDGSSRAPKP